MAENKEGRLAAARDSARRLAADKMASARARAAASYASKVAAAAAPAVVSDAIDVAVGDSVGVAAAPLGADPLATAPRSVSLPPKTRASAT